MNVNVSKLASALLAIATGILPMRAHATPPPAAADDHAARAEARFHDASEAFDHGRIAEACAAFRESAELYATLGTTLNLALCHERQGKKASAWVEFTHAAAWADETNEHDRRDFARQHASLLERALERVQIEVPADGPVTELAIDGEPLVSTRQSIQAFLDAGVHEITARAALRTPYTTRVTVSGKGAPQVIVRIPTLAFASQESAPVTPEQESVSGLPSRRRTAGWVVGGFGIVAVGVGAGLAIDGLVKTGDVGACTTHCTAGPAELAEIASLAAFGTGLAALATSGWLLFADPKAAPSSGAHVRVVPRMTARGGGLALSGAW